MLFAEALRSAMFGAFRFSGRSDRLEHWTFAFLTAVMVTAVIIAGQMGLQFRGFFVIVLSFAALWLLMANVALFVRRLHDHGRSGLYLLFPFAALSLMFVGWLGQNGYVHFYTQFFIDHGRWISLSGRVLGMLSLSYLGLIFVGEGDPDRNEYGEPPL